MAFILGTATLNSDYQPFSPRFIRDILSKEKLWLSRSRGQNYLICREIAESIAATVPAKIPVFEVGGGLGALTHLVAEKQPITSIEVDFGIFTLFGRLFTHPNLKLIHADFLKFDFEKLEDQEWYFLSNLPYSISGEAIRTFVNEPRFKKGTLMLQKEFVDRMLSKSGNKLYGVLSILSQTFLEIHIENPSVHSKCFFPEPSVSSVVVTIRKKAQDFSQDALRKFVMTGFAKRRKTLANNLKTLGISAAEIEKTGLDPKIRPEQVSPQDWINLMQSL